MIRTHQSVCCFSTACWARAFLTANTASCTGAARLPSSGGPYGFPSLSQKKKNRGGLLKADVGIVVRASSGGGSSSSSDETFLTMEEAGLIDLSNLEMHERFLCRLTVSSLNLLRVISKQEGKPIEQLNAGIICDWFQKDKAKRETDFESATLKW